MIAGGLMQMLTAVDETIEIAVGVHAFSLT
jgi:hypothetical protein